MFYHILPKHMMRCGTVLSKEGNCTDLGGFGTELAVRGETIPPAPHRFNN